MLKLIPTPKKITEEGELLSKKSVKYCCDDLDYRVANALKKIPNSCDGVEVKITVSQENSEAYTLKVSNDEIVINAKSDAAAFYAIQTLRQILDNDVVPCCYIEDEPRFEYRGFYQDATRGKIATVETFKKLIDDMAFCKLNALQIYVEHTYDFKEYKDIHDRTGYLTAEEIKELDQYCIDNFIEFIPSLATFGHLYELLQQDKYKHLCVLENYEPKEHMWWNRQKHHVIDPTNPESFELIKSLLDQYMPLFTSKRFNICCDETFDMAHGKCKDMDTRKLYLEFVYKIINYLQSKGKVVQMWTDVLGQGTMETLMSNIQYNGGVPDDFPEGVELMPGYYEPTDDEMLIKIITDANRPCIACPGTTTWCRFIEKPSVSESNISLMAKNADKYGAYGFMNTNWGDWGNPCSIEMAMYGFSMGAEKAWNVNTEFDDDFAETLDLHIYKKKGATKLVKELSYIYDNIGFTGLGMFYSDMVYENKFNPGKPKEETLRKTHDAAFEFIDKIGDEKWERDEYRQELILVAEAICVITGLFAKICEYDMEQKVDTKEWLDKYSKKWLEKNKQSELAEIQKVFLYLEDM